MHDAWFDIDVVYSALAIKQATRRSQQKLVKNFLAQHAEGPVVGISQPLHVNLRKIGACLLNVREARIITPVFHNGANESKVFVLLISPLLTGLVCSRQLVRFHIFGVGEVLT